jgi:hypothetical protein
VITLLPDRERSAHHRRGTVSRSAATFPHAWPARRSSCGARCDTAGQAHRWAYQKWLIPPRSELIRGRLIFSYSQYRTRTFIECITVSLVVR